MKVSIIPFILKKLKQGLGIVQDTDTATQAIAKDKYVFWKGSVKKASSAISQNDTLSASNLGDVSGGALNDIADQIVTLSPSTSVTATTITGYSSINDYTISQNGFYSIYTQNDTGQGTTATNLIIEIQNANSDVLWSCVQMDAPRYHSITSPIFYLNAGIYKIRTTGGISKLLKYS